jgi:hypothetical protein
VRLIPFFNLPIMVVDDGVTEEDGRSWWRRAARAVADGVEQPWSDNPEGRGGSSRRQRSYAELRHASPLPTATGPERSTGGGDLWGGGVLARRRSAGWRGSAGRGCSAGRQGGGDLRGDGGDGRLEQGGGEKLPAAQDGRRRAKTAKTSGRYTVRAA